MFLGENGKNGVAVKLAETLDPLLSLINGTQVNFIGQQMALNLGGLEFFDPFDITWKTADHLYGRMTLPNSNANVYIEMKKLAWRNMIRKGKKIWKSPTRCLSLL